MSTKGQHKEVRVRLADDDDPAFLALVDRVLRTTVETIHPMEIYLTRVKNWFDHKWLGFSGYRVVTLPSYLHVIADEGLRETWQEALTFPPFTPNRIVTQRYICWTTKSFYQEQPVIDLVHEHKRQHSDKNLKRKAADHTPSGLFVWYSSNTAANGQGSLMVYEAYEGQAWAWYASFERDEDWKLRSTKGRDRNRIAAMLPGESR